MSDIAQRIRAFDESHGKDPVFFDGWLLFSDGASRETNPFGALCEPSPDAYQRSKFIVGYFEIKLELAVEDFTICKRNCLQPVVNVLRQKDCPLSPTIAEEVTLLKKLKKKVVIAQSKLADAKADLEKRAEEINTSGEII